MFQIGETVVYGTTGVCTIVSLGPLSMQGVDRHRLYYTLQPIHSSGSVYVPAEGEKLKAMRYPMTREDAEMLLSRIPEIEPCDIRNQNFKQRSDIFSAALSQNSGDGLVQVLKAITQKKQQGKDKQYNSDNTVFKRAMTLLCGELSFSLDLPLEEIRGRVERAILPPTTPQK